MAILQSLARVLLALLLALAPMPIIELRQAMGPESHATPYIRPEFAAQMRQLRPVILAAARRHNRPELSRMSDEQFAATIAQLLYNEHFGWLEDSIPALRGITPAYQWFQIELNQVAGTDMSVWPSNLRPSVAAEILRGELPVPGGAIDTPARARGSLIDPRDYADQRAFYRAINAEISRPEPAIEFLAANLQRGLERAHYEGTPATWQTLAAWHNQGIVRPEDIRRNPAAMHYIRRAAAYRIMAEQLIAAPHTQGSADPS